MRVLCLSILAAVCVSGCGDESTPAGDGGGTTSSEGPATSATTEASTGADAGTSSGSAEASSAGSSTGGESTEGQSTGSESTGSTGEAACTRPPAVLGEQLWLPTATGAGGLVRISTTAEAQYRTSDVNPQGAFVHAASVNLNGDAVAGTNNGQAPEHARGSVTMFAGSLDDCPDPTQTSAGPDDELPYPDGCVVWRTDVALDFVEMVAWTPGEWSAETCRYENTRVWVTGGTNNYEGPVALLLDGETGAIVDEVSLESLVVQAAVDADGNLWAETVVGPPISIALEDLAVTTLNEVPAGDMTVAPDGAIWACGFTGVYRRDPLSEVWTEIGDGEIVAHCRVNAAGEVWGAARGGGITATTADGTVFVDIDLPDAVSGVNFDGQGRVWVATHVSGGLLLVDPDTSSYQVVHEAFMSITNGDLTGVQLDTVTGGKR